MVVLVLMAVAMLMTVLVVRGSHAGRDGTRVSDEAGPGIVAKSVGWESTSAPHRN
jgi:hypothetical protein